VNSEPLFMKMTLSVIIPVYLRSITLLCQHKCSDRMLCLRRTWYLCDVRYWSTVVSYVGWLAPNQVRHGLSSYLFNLFRVYNGPCDELVNRSEKSTRVSPCLCMIYKNQPTITLAFSLSAVPKKEVT